MQDFPRDKLFSPAEPRWTYRPDGYNGIIGDGDRATVSFEDDGARHMAIIYD